MPPLRVTLLTYGTRGDVQPFVALARGLRQAGCQVHLAAPAHLAALVRAHDLDFTPLPGDPAELSRLLSEAGPNPLRFFHPLLDYARPLAIEVLESARVAAQGADVIVHSFLMTVAGHTLARELDIPDLSAQLFPVFASTAAYPNLTLTRSLGGPLNRLSHWGLAQLFWLGNRLGYWQLRQHNPTLSPRINWPFARSPERPPTPLLFAFSSHVVPRPPDWPAHIQTPGYWFLDDPTWEAPAALEAFLGSGPAPVCIGFGSTVSDEIPILTRVALEALERTGQRGLLLGGWGALGQEGLLETVFLLDAAPHDRLYPRMAAVVHHGGAGTTAAGLRAGVPSIMVPFTTDQPFWGRRVAALGVGPEPIARTRLTTERLAAAIQQTVTDSAMQARARHLGQMLQAEQGVENAVRIILDTARSF